MALIFRPVEFFFLFIDKHKRYAICLPFDQCSQVIINSLHVSAYQKYFASAPMIPIVTILLTVAR